jgi:xanthine dehydrogenase YagR molybdenum-binding subunit
MADDNIYYDPKYSFPRAPREGNEPAPWSRTNVVGRGEPRVDGYERATGTAIYPSDVALPGLLHGAILGCPHANARVKRVDASKALDMPGVYAVITRDTPGGNPDWSYSGNYTGKLFNDHCRFEGDAVAAVAADTPYRAADALRAVKVEYEVLPHVSDYEKALEDGAPLVHEDGNTVKRDSYSRGDIETGFAQADVVVEETYRSACELHTPLEPHGCMVRWEGDRLTVWESTQGVYSVQSKIAEVLGLPLSRVRVIGHYMGGGFGSKLWTSKYSIAAALLAKRAGRPVRMFLTREQTFLTMGNRPPSTMTVKLGAKKDGALTAISFEGLGTGGAYQSGGTSLLDWLAKDLYKCDNVATELTDVYINAQKARPFRAPGYVQGCWAMEQAMDALAEKLGMCPVDLRVKNVAQGSQARGDTPYTTEGLRLCLEQGAREFGWDKARQRTVNQKPAFKLRGVGMAACNWFVGDGGPPSTIVLKIFADGTANLNMGASDIGTGTKTVMAMVVAEELGIELEDIQVEHADTGTTQFATPSGGSKTVPTEAPAVRRACIEVKRQLREMAAEDLGVGPDKLIFAGNEIRTSDGAKSIKVRELGRLKQQKIVVGVGNRRPNPDDVRAAPFAAQFCEVEVDTLTGELRILRMLGVNESGRVIDRLTWDGQLVGGVTMGVGFANTEFRVLDGPTGKLCNKNWHDYKLPTALDVPAEVTSSPVMLSDDEANITGAKGLGEPVTIPTGPAIANAVYNAVGLRMTDTPVNPVTLMAALAKHKEA